MGCCSSTKQSHHVKYLEDSNAMTTQTESTDVSDNKESKMSGAHDPMDLVYYRLDGSLRQYSYNLTRHQSRLQSLMQKQIDHFYQRFNDGTFVVPILKQCSMINNNNYNIPQEITNLIASFVGMIKYKPPDIVFHLNTCAKGYLIPPVSMDTFEVEISHEHRKEYIKYLTQTKNILIPIQKLAIENHDHENKHDNDVKNTTTTAYEAEQIMTTIDDKLFNNEHFSRLATWYFGGGLHGGKNEYRLNPQIKIYFDQLNHNNNNSNNNNDNNANDNKENENEIRNQINSLADECHKIDVEDRDQGKASYEKLIIDLFQWDHLKTVSNNDVDIEIILSSKYFAKDAQGDSALLQALYLLNFENSIVNGQFCIEKPVKIEVNSFIQHKINKGCFDSNCSVLISNDECECDNQVMINCKKNIKWKKVCDLRSGDKIVSFGNKVSTILYCIEYTIDDSTKMCQISDDCWVTFEHPILMYQLQSQAISQSQECVAKGATAGSINSINMNTGSIGDININCCNVEYESDQVVQYYTTKISKEIEMKIGKTEFEVEQCNNCQLRLDSDVIKKYNLEWKLPKNVFNVIDKYSNKIYNFILDNNHTINVNGNWCVTLGHDWKGNVIQHPFWGNSSAMKQYAKTIAAQNDTIRVY